MDYRTVTDVTSRQYQLIYSEEVVVGEDGLLYSGEYIGCALASRFGEIGDKFIVTLDNYKQIKVIKLDEKSDAHTTNNCHHSNDGSVIEFVIDRNKFAASYPLADAMGDVNYADKFSGYVTKIQKVVEN